MLVPALRKQLLHPHNDNINEAMTNISKFNVIPNSSVELYDNVNAVFSPLNGSLYVWYNDSLFTFRADVIKKTDHMSRTHEGTVPRSCLGSTVVSPGWYRPVEHRGTSSSVRSWLHAPLSILISLCCSMLCSTQVDAFKWRGKKGGKANTKQQQQQQPLHAFISWCLWVTAVCWEQLVPLDW